MKASWLFRLFVVSVVALLTLVPSLPALALPPETATFHNQSTGDEIADCGDFLALEDTVTDGSVTTFFDRNGDPVRAQIHSHLSGTIYNSVTGKSLSDFEPLTLFIDITSGTTTWVGLTYHVNAPGWGSVLLGAGRVVFDANGNMTFEAGPHQVTHGEVQDLCAALAEP